MSFGKILQKIRRNKKKTQKDIADLINMDYGYFSRIENDKFEYKPSKQTIEKMAEALECDDAEKAELFAAADRIDEEFEKVAKLSNERPEIRTLFRALPGLSKDKIQEFLDSVERDKSNKK